MAPKINRQKRTYYGPSRRLRGARMPPTYEHLQFDLFDALGIVPSQSLHIDDFDRAYKRCALVLHPDKAHHKTGKVPQDFPQLHHAELARNFFINGDLGGRNSNHAEPYEEDYGDFANRLFTAYSSHQNRYQSTWNPNAGPGTDAVLQPIPNAREEMDSVPPRAPPKRKLKDESEGASIKKRKTTRPKKESKKETQKETREVQKLKDEIKKLVERNDKLRGQLKELEQNSMIAAEAITAQSPEEEEKLTEQVAGSGAPVEPETRLEPVNSGFVFDPKWV